MEKDDADIVRLAQTCADLRVAAVSIRHSLTGLRISMARIAQAAGVDNSILNITDASYQDLHRKAQDEERGWNDLAGETAEQVTEFRRQASENAERVLTMSKALGVITKTQRIYVFLDANDPMALKQALAALEEQE